MKSTVRFFVFSFLTSLIMLLPATVVAVDDIGEFEMDGDAVMDAANPPEGDDWSTLWDDGYNNGGNPIVFTGIKPDPAPLSIFEGGKKDILDVSAWRWKAGSVPDKDDITNAYAAAYHCPEAVEDCDAGDLIAFFGADRLSNSGDAFMGFWFFKGNVTALEDGRFSGTHLAGDVLILVNFPQASSAEPQIQVVSWDTACMKADKNLNSYPEIPVPTGTNCAAKNLQLLYDGIVCGEPWPNPGGDNACAITNLGSITAPWTYSAKSPDPDCPGCFPYESFFEGGINLTRLVSGAGGDACFASFMAETRSSEQFTATLKDFSLDQFPLCAVELSKVCHTGTYVEGNLAIPYEVTVTNTGSAPVTWIDATDDLCGTGDTALLEFGPLLAGESETLGGTCLIAPGTISDTIYNGVTAVASDAIPVFLADSCATDDDNEGWCFDACDLDLDPSISVTKDCDTVLVAEDNAVKVKVEFTGSVTNTSNEGLAPAPLDNVQVWDNKGTDAYSHQLVLTNTTTSETGYAVSLEPGETATFEGEYLPDGTGLGWSKCPESATFTDQVEAMANEVFEGTSVGPEYAPATCSLCESGNCD